MQTEATCPSCNNPIEQATEAAQGIHEACLLAEQAEQESFNRQESEYWHRQGESA